MVDQKWFFYHDLFNMIALPIVYGATQYYHLQDDESFFYVQFFVFISYLILDTIWLLIKPDSVASIKSVLPHHFICLMGWNLNEINKYYLLYKGLPSPGPKYDRFISIGALVELNTFLLVLRRNTHYNAIVEFFFYATWVYIRCFLYPRGLINVTSEFISVLYNRKQFLCIEFFVVLLFFPLNVLNLKWTVDLITRSFSKEKRKEYKSL